MILKRTIDLLKMDRYPLSYLLSAGGGVMPLTPNYSYAYFFDCLFILSQLSPHFEHSWSPAQATHNAQLFLYYQSPVHLHEHLILWTLIG